MSNGPLHPPCLWSDHADPNIILATPSEGSVIAAFGIRTKAPLTLTLTGTETVVASLYEDSLLSEVLPKHLLGFMFFFGGGCCSQRDTN